MSTTGEVRTIKINGGTATATASASDIQEPLETPDGVMIKGGSYISEVGQKTSRRGGGRRTRRIGGALGVTESEPAPKSSIGEPPLNGVQGSVRHRALPDGEPIINVTKVMMNAQRGGNETASKTNIPPPPVLDATIPKVTESVIQQGAGTTKVILKSKNRTAKILLKKKIGGSASGSATVISEQQGGSVNQKGKKTRRLVLKHVSKRLKKTRHVVKQAKEMPLADLKKILITKKLIKSTSKAPESILRQIYADSLIVGKKTL